MNAIQYFVDANSMLVDRFVVIFNDTIATILFT